MTPTMDVMDLENLPTFDGDEEAGAALIIDARENVIEWLNRMRRKNNFEEENNLPD